MSEPAARARQPDELRVMVLHHQRLVADTYAAVLKGAGGRLQVSSTTDPSRVLRADDSIEVLLAEQRLVPPGLRWHRFGRADGASFYIALGDNHQRPTVAAVAALRAGARAWVPPDLPMHQLVEVVNVVADGQLWLPARQVDAILQALTAPQSTAPGPFGLTAREQTVLELVSAGRSTREISRILALSPNTVRTHRQRLFTKLGVHSAVEAAALLRATRAKA